MIKLRKIKLIHPGEILMEEFLLPLELSQTQLAKNIQVSPRRINEIVQGKRSMSADTALRLSCYFGMSAQFWLGLQMDYDLNIQKDKVGSSVYDRIQKRREKLLLKKKNSK
ncbi:Antitoxin HigA [hydrothermal vent metagenome]|uniref:Antitoxin HigA n=1 Tax=hydrothermal vent metagenome TaxID=652676 RepID=A0A3B0TBE6_9ZZZZ